MTIQTKIGGGLNKLQDTIQTGKQKMQLVQETSQVKTEMEQIRQERIKLIIQLGNDIHLKIRKGLEKDENLLKLSALIERLDKEIYSKAKQLELLKAQQASDTASCSGCKNPVQPTDKFCGHCGEAVAQQKTSEETLEKACMNCETNITESAVFCPCCGISVKE
ncbi:zinc ribbon domain-containing protein [Sporosarcina sp. Marseille-Q4943]|uniref:zinc ribbon domain-containing protein n=1 Tax=Sporosarcina sp. Marseille-Q4943 TaxID=2942204 RepID=UPI00208DCFC2|nr:zinc ribbon domain-containing protein [Sporosarcina sp. Marseille-Q4943]